MAILATRFARAPGLLLASGLLVLGCGRSGLDDLDLGGPTPPSGGVHTSSCTPGSTNGTPVTLASDGSQVMALAVDPTSVYWLDAQGNVMKVSKCGGTATTLASAGTAYGSSGGGTGLTIDSENAYWVDDPGDVLAVPLAGGTPTTLASNVPNASGITVQGSDLYWVTPSLVEAMPIQGGARSTLAMNSPYSPWTYAFWPNVPAADDTSIYWIAGDGVCSVPRAGGAVVTLATGRAGAGLAIDDANVYWCATGDASTPVLRTPKTGGPSVTLATDQLGATAFAVDAQNVYWAIGGLPEGSVMRVPIAGGTPVTLASGSEVDPVVLDDTSVYWAEYDGTPTTPGTASVMRLSPK